MRYLWRSRGRVAPMACAIPGRLGSDSRCRSPEFVRTCAQERPFRSGLRRDGPTSAALGRYGYKSEVLGGDTRAQLRGQHETLAKGAAVRSTPGWHSELAEGAPVRMPGWQR